MALLPYIVHLPLIFSLCFLIKKKYNNEPLSAFYWPGLALKLISGIVLGLLYFNHYRGGDTVLFQKYATILTEYFHSDKDTFISIFFLNDVSETTKMIIPVWAEPRTMFMIKLISVLNFFTFSNYWINSLYFSFFSFTGIWFLGNKIQKEFNVSPQAIAFSFLFFPSVVFWSSGLIKDSLIVGIICFILFLFLKIRKDNKIQLKDLILLAILFYFGWKIKFYYTAILIGIVASFIITHFTASKFSIKKAVAGCIILPLIFIGLFSISSLLIPSLNLDYILFIMHYSYEFISKGSGDFSFYNLQANPLSYIINFPLALVTGLFRPLPWDTSGLFPFLTSLENVVLLFLFITWIYSVVKTKSAKPNLITYSLLLYIFLAAALMAFIAPNWGTLSRYKAGYLLFWILFLTHKNLLFDTFIQKTQSLLSSRKNSVNDNLKNY